MEKNNKVLVTGGAGFFGSILSRYLKKRGYEVTIFDMYFDKLLAKKFNFYHGDLRRKKDIENCFKKSGPFKTVYHLAAMLAHDVKDKKALWHSNVNGTQNLVEVCIKNHYPKIIFTSSNCIFAKPTIKPLSEDAKPAPIEIYGKSKLRGEKILLNYKDKIASTIIRCPTIISYGRLGLLAILFEFIKDNKKIPVVGMGDNRYQFIYALDLADACLKAAKISGTQVYNIGSDEVKSLKEVYRDVINFAHSKSKIYSLPKGPAIFAMKLGHILHLSPLGPYHYRMIAENFIFDTSKIKRELHWQPTKTNSEILSFAYKYYLDNLDKIEKNQNLPAHRKKAPMGVIKVLKWLS